MNLPERWLLLTDEESIRFSAELKREVCNMHPLFAKECIAIARIEKQDDFLFKVVDDLKHTFYIVHLTWQQEYTADFPWATAFRSFDDFVLNWQCIYD